MYVVDKKERLSTSPSGKSQFTGNNNVFPNLYTRYDGHFIVSVDLVPFAPPGWIFYRHERLKLLLVVWDFRPRWEVTSWPYTLNTRVIWSEVGVWSHQLRWRFGTTPCSNLFQRTENQDERTYVAVCVEHNRVGCPCWLVDTYGYPAILFVVSVDMRRGGCCSPSAMVYLATIACRRESGRARVCSGLAQGVALLGPPCVREERIWPSRRTWGE